MASCPHQIEELFEPDIVFVFFLQTASSVISLFYSPAIYCDHTDFVSMSACINRFALEEWRRWKLACASIVAGTVIGIAGWESCLHSKGVHNRSRSPGEETKTAARTPTTAIQTPMRVRMSCRDHPS